MVIGQVLPPVAPPAAPVSTAAPKVTATTQEPWHPPAHHGGTIAGLSVCELGCVFCFVAFVLNYLGLSVPGLLQRGNNGAVGQRFLPPNAAAGAAKQPGQ